MEFEQISKQVNWLDEERRKDKLQISSMEEHLKELEGKILPLEKRNIEIEGQIARFGAILTRFDEMDEALLQIRVETKQQFESLEKFSKKREDETEKLRRADQRSLETSIADIRKEVDQFPEVKRNIKNRVEEELRLGRLIDEVRNRVESMRRSDEEYVRSIRVLEDGRRQDSERITDLAGEASATRKKADEQGGRLELVIVANKKLETRLNELNAVETERREAISNFLNSQELREVDRERLWKEWQTRFEQVESQATEIESSLQTLDTTHRTVKRFVQTIEELTQKVERRINEISEIQRLAEERFRQEWTTFKADDQKRWTNYILTMDEQRNEAQRQHEKLADKVVNIEDEIQEIQDMLQQVNEHTEKRLQSLLAMTHEWVSSYERTVGRAR